MKNVRHMRLSQDGKLINFQIGHMSLTDEPKAGRPSLKAEATTVKKVEDLILADRRVTIQLTMQETRLRSGSVPKIIHEELHVSKVPARRCQAC